MSGLFGGPKIPSPLPVVNQSDIANRMNDAMSRKLSSGGTNSATVANQVAPTGGAHLATLTGLG